jgi:ABC-type lipoprotein export system ATPase subunit
MTAMQQIVLEDVVKNYSIGGQPIIAVNHVSLKINKGEFISIVGHSGSEKTTLLSMIGGIIQPTSGRICSEEQTSTHLTVTGFQNTV